VKIYASVRTEEEELDKFLLPADGENVHRCWESGLGHDLRVLQAALILDKPKTVVIQFNYGFFEFAALRELLVAVKGNGSNVVVMFHSTCDPPELPARRLELLSDALAKCDRLLVHTPRDLNRLKALGLIHNTALLPHGVLEMQMPAKRVASGARPNITNCDDTRCFQVASFGFLLPHKGLEELVDAIGLLKQRGLSVSLHMLNAEYPAEVSRQSIAAVQARIKEAGLETEVNLETTYYTNEECLERLAVADLIVFPYQLTQESASGAVRHAIASGAPVAVTPLPIFEDVAPAVIELEGVTPHAIADSIERVTKWEDEQWSDYWATANRWRRQHGYSAVAQRLEAMIGALAVAPIRS
jgi:glycosyltransferase involved in cell wall biosynthesis